MSGNWLRASVIGLSLALFTPAIASAQNEATLDTVVVTASRTEEKLREVTSNVTVITEKDIKKSTATNVGQLLSQNGFQTYDNGGGSRALYIRGIGSSSMTTHMDSPILFLLNGHRTGTNNMSLLGLSNVERVEVIRGPAAMQYGPAAVGGVVNIITKRGQEDFTAMVELGVGSFGRLDQKLGFSGATGGLDFSGTVANSRNDDYQTGGGDTWRYTRTKGKLGFDLDLGYTVVENNRLGVHFNYFNIDDDYIPSDGWSDTKSYPAGYGINNNYIHNTTFSYEGATEDKLLSWNTAYTFGRNKNKSSTYYEPGYPYPWFGSTYLPDKSSIYDTKTDNQEGQAQVAFDNGLLSLTAGFDYMGSKYESASDSYPFIRDPNEYSYNKFKVTDWGTYLLGKLRFMDESLILTAGGRYDRYKNSSLTDDFVKSDSNWSPSVGLAWLPIEFLKLRTNYSEGFRLPSPSAILGDGKWYIPNLYLKPEKSQTYEIGGDLSWKFIEAHLTYFYTNYKDKVVTEMLNPWPYQGQNVNLDGTAVHAGIEFGLGVDVGQALDQEFSLTPYVNLTWMTKRKNGDKTRVVPQDPDVLPNVPEFLAAYGLTFEHEGIGLSSTLNASYFGKRYTQDWSNSSPTYGDYLKFGGFTVVNLSLDKRLWDFEDKGRLGLRAEVNNLFDKDYAYNMDFPMPGRNFYVGLKFEYN